MRPPNLTGNSQSETAIRQGLREHSLVVLPRATPGQSVFKNSSKASLSASLSTVP